MLTCIVDNDGVVVASHCAPIGGRRLGDFHSPLRRQSPALSAGRAGVGALRSYGLLVLSERSTCERPIVRADLGRRTCAYDLAAAVAAVRSKVDDPVARANHIEVVLDDQQ